MESKKIKAARLSIFSNSLLVTLKVLAGLFSGSVSILSEAIHSLMDLVASFIAWVSVRISGTPPDAQHPYGHGKFENISGVVESILIFIAAGWIIFEAIGRILQPSPVEHLYLGIAVMGISAMANFLISRHLYHVARATDSIALEADALHLKTDVYTSLGVMVGLSLIYITGIPMVDPVIAILVACLILWESYQLFMKAYQPLLDKSLTIEEIHRIELVISRFSDQFHDLRTRRAGPIRFVDFHLEVHGDTTVEIAHSLCNRIEEALLAEFPHMEINIHVENLQPAR